MLRLKPRQREILLEKGLLNSEPFSIPIAIGGLAIWMVVMGLAVAFAEEPR